VDEQTKKLIIALTEKTFDSKLNWDKTSRDNEFVCAVQSGSITIDSYWQYNDYEGEEVQYLDIAVLNILGEVIERTTFSADDGSDYKLLQTLYQAAHRRHYKIDEVITSIIDSISSL
jgi:hypothetical protein